MRTVLPLLPGGLVKKKPFPPPIAKLDRPPPSPAPVVFFWRRALPPNRVIHPQIFFLFPPCPPVTSFWFSPAGVFCSSSVPRPPLFCVFNRPDPETFAEPKEIWAVCTGFVPHRRLFQRSLSAIANCGFFFFLFSPFFLCVCDPLCPVVRPPRTLSPPRGLNQAHTSPKESVGEPARNTPPPRSTSGLPPPGPLPVATDFRLGLFGSPLFPGGAEEAARTPVTILLERREQKTWWPGPRPRIAPPPGKNPRPGSFHPPPPFFAPGVVVFQTESQLPPPARFDGNRRRKAPPCPPPPPPPPPPPCAPEFFLPFGTVSPHASPAPGPSFPSPPPWFPHGPPPPRRPWFRGSGQFPPRIFFFVSEEFRTMTNRSPPPPMFRPPFSFFFFMFFVRRPPKFET